MKPFANSEVGRLQDVLLCTIENFALHLPINQMQEHYYSVDPPRLEILLEQQLAFAAMLQQHNVRVHWAEPQPTSPLQFFTRDVAVAIADKLVVGAMAKHIRAQERDSLQSLLISLDNPPLYVSEGVVEGGDVILDGSIIYVGLSERTDRHGFMWVRKTFSTAFDILELEMNPGYIHLDTVLNLIGGNKALVYRPAFSALTLVKLEQKYEMIPVTAEEQFRLATNVLSLSPHTIVSDRQNVRINDVLRQDGFEVIDVDFSEIVKIGGGFRCATCPLVRDAL